MTTSSRYQRAEARHLRDSHPTVNARTQNLLAHQQNSRLKRRFDTIDHDFDAIKYKKARITVEIPARPTARHSRPAIDSFDAKSHVAATRHPPNPSPQPAPPGATVNKPTNAKNTATTTASRSSAPNPNPTKHNKKVANGLMHELNRLQPNSVDTKDQGGRKLRSQEGTRFKSELSAYFPDYDEVIGNDPKEYHILNSDTPIIVTNAEPTPENNSTSLPQQPSTLTKDQPPWSGDTSAVRGYGDDLFADLWESQVIDFSFLDTGKPPHDPLPDSAFEPAHKKAERLERSIRNAEKGRAQHERDQVIRLLEGLQGHDWLRVMGVSGITESKKKQFEPARAHFIKGCQVILGKFRAWAEEEKRLKLKKERAAAEAEAEQEDEEEDEDIEQNDEVEEIQDSEDEGEDADMQMSDDEQEDANSDGDPPDLSDVDASIAKQLREEAIAAAKTKLKKSRAAATRELDQLPEPPREFTSYFSKKYQRDAAMSKSRRKGRTVMAFGQPLPEVPEKEFELPDGYLSEDTLKTRERRKRRERRGKK